MIAMEDDDEMRVQKVKNYGASRHSHHNKKNGTNYINYCTVRGRFCPEINFPGREISLNKSAT